MRNFCVKIAKRVTRFQGSAYQQIYIKYIYMFFEGVGERSTRRKPKQEREKRANSTL